MPPGVDVRPIGVTGLNQQGGYVYEEFLTELQGPRGVRVYREMSENDPVVGAILYALEMLVRRVQWFFTPADETDEAREAAVFVEECLHDMSISWADVLSEVLTMLPYGWCLPPDQKILGKDGKPFPISNVKVGDLVLTKEGRARKVNRIYTRPFDGNLVSIKVRGYPEPIRMTPEHKVPTLDGWKRAGELTSSDVLLRPIPQVEEGGNYDAGWIVGTFLAEGTLGKRGRNRVDLSIHIDEVDEYKARISRFVDEDVNFGVYQKSGYGAHLYFSNAKVRALIEEWVEGRSAYTKALKKSPIQREFIRGIIDGWVFGDGHTNTRIGTSACTKSEALAHQMQLLAAAVGKTGSMQKDRAGTYTVMLNSPKASIRKRTPELEQKVREMAAAGVNQHRIARTLGITDRTVNLWTNSSGPKQVGSSLYLYPDQGLVGHQIQSIREEPYNGIVYDIEVDEDHTFCAGPIAVSNCYMEIIYKIRQGDTDDPTRRSKYNDGKIGWRKWSIRSQDSLDRWEFDEEGGVQGMWQRAAPDYVPRFIPIDKALLFRTNTRKSNPEGRSVLRNAYRAWFFKKQLEFIEAVGVERDLAGLPVMYVPSEIMAKNAKPEQKELLALCKKIVTNIRRDEQEGVIIPLAYDNNNNPIYKLELLTAGGSRQFDTDKIISRYDQRIAMVVLADFILLGHENVGSHALSVSKSDIFVTALESVLDSIASVINHHAIPRLLRLNGMNTELAPVMNHSTIRKVNLAELGAYIEKLAGVGLPLFPNKELEQRLLEVAGLPLPTEEEIEGREVDAEQQVLEGDGDEGDEDQSQAATEGNYDPKRFHLRGEHNQKTHGHRGSGTATKPKTKTQLIAEKLSQGKAVKDVAKEMGIPYQQVYQVAKKKGTGSSGVAPSPSNGASKQPASSSPSGRQPTGQVIAKAKDGSDLTVGSTFISEFEQQFTIVGMTDTGNVKVKYVGEGYTKNKEYIVAPEHLEWLAHTTDPNYKFKSAKKSIAELHAEGKSVSEISKELGVKYQSVYQKVKALEKKGAQSGVTKANIGQAPQISAAAKAGAFVNPGVPPNSSWDGHWKSWQASLSQDEISAIKGYTGSHFMKMNSLLRDGQYDPKKAATDPTTLRVKNASRALDRAVLPTNTILYRGTDLPVDFDTWKPGKIIEDKGFVSTSINRATSITWGSGAFFEIRAPAGSKGAYVQHISSFKAEWEVILQHSTRFRVISVDKQPGKRPVVVVEIVDQGEAL